MRIVFASYLVRGASTTGDMLPPGRATTAATAGVVGLLLPRLVARGPLPGDTVHCRCRVFLGSHAKREDPSFDLADLVVLGAAIASLIAVGAVLAGAGRVTGNLKYLQAGFAVLSVFVSWTLIHSLFTLRYARLYYSGRAGGIDFNETGTPDYRDFAYLSFTIGMTFQVSDTNIQSKQIRRTALGHAWLSFPWVW